MIALICEQGLWLALGIQGLVLMLFAWRWHGLRDEKRRWPREPEGGWPDLEVLLCLRGADAALPALLASLAAQAYSGCWHLNLVVDSEDDPAWGLVDPWLTTSQAGWSSIRRERLHNRPVQGSLKCAALRQACACLRPTTKLVVLLDADASLAPDGLQRLARACWRPGVGAVSGNRWYAPDGCGLLAWSRAVWGAAALVLMTLLHIPWGGNLALRRELVDAGSWTQLLERGLCEDTGLLGPLQQLGMRYEPRPELLVLERSVPENWDELYDWISRQILNTRLHHPAGLLVLCYGLGSMLVLLLLGVAVLNGIWWVALGYELGCWILLLCLQAVVIRRWSQSRQVMGWLLGVLPGQVINSATTVGAWLQRKVAWRGVTYQVTQRPVGVRLIAESKRLRREPASTDAVS